MNEFTPLDAIRVGDRIRRDLGDITGLAQSVQQHETPASDCYH